MGSGKKETLTCQHCGAEADITVEGFEKVEDVIKRKKKVTCKTCGQEFDTETSSRKAFTCQHCGAEADMTLEGFEGVAEVIQREKKLLCKTCGREVPWTKREDIEIVRVAMEAEKDAYQAYSKAAKKTMSPKGRDMLHQQHQPRPRRQHVDHQCLRRFANRRHQEPGRGRNAGGWPCRPERKA